MEMETTTYLPRTRSGSTGSMFVSSDEVQWKLKDGSSSFGWVVSVNSAEETAWVFHADGSSVKCRFTELRLVNRYPPTARPRISILVQSCVIEDVVPKPNFEEMEEEDFPSVMKNFVRQVQKQINSGMTDELFGENCGHLAEIQSVYDTIGELEEQIRELSAPNKNVIWLNQQRRELEENIDQLNDRVANLTSERNDLHTEVEHLKEMNAKFVGSYKQFLEQKQLLVNTSKTLDEQKQDLESQLMEEKHRTLNLTEENTRQANSISTLETQNSELERDLNETKTLFKEEITKREEAQLKVAQLERANSDLLSQLELLISANRELQQGLREWRVQNQDIFAQLKNLSNRKLPAELAQNA